MDDRSWTDELTDSGFFGTEGADGAAALDPAVVDLVDELVAHAPPGLEGLLPVLLGLQRAFDRVSWRNQELVADRFGLSPAQVAAVVSFYPELSKERRGRVELSVCTGASCHLRGSDAVLASVDREVGDLPMRPAGRPLITVRQERCLGVCGRGAAVRAGDRIHTGLDPNETADLVGRLRGVGPTSAGDE
jgi:NADH-quinone oxidoreductase subunit E/NADP-reducing hydrogenase subunit HndA